MKNLNCIVTLALALIMILTACGGASTTPASSSSSQASSEAAANTTPPVAIDTDKKVTIRFEDFNGNGDNEKHLHKMIEEFNKVYPNIVIDLQTVAYDGYTTQLMAKISAGQAPDVYELSYDDFLSFAAKNVLTPLDDIIAAKGIDLSVYNQTVLESFRYNGTLYGFPSNFSNVVMFYNKDLFDQAGVDYPNNTWTWVDAEEAAKKIRALGDNIYGYFRPTTYNEFYKVVAQNGGSIMNEDQTAFTVNTPEAVGAVEYMVSLINGSNVQPTEEQMAGMGGWDLFTSGRCGMLMTGIWGIPTFTSDCEFNWDIEMEPGNKKHATHFFTNAFVIDQKSQVAEEAAIFINFLTSNKAAVNIGIDANWILPALSDQSVIDRYSAITPPNNKKAVFESLNYLVLAPSIEQSNEVADIINAAILSVVNKKMTAQEALDDCQKQLEEKIKLQ